MSVLYAGSLVDLMEHDLGPAFAHASGYGYQGIGAGSTELVQQIKGKVRHRLTVPADLDAAALEKMVLADPEVRKLIAGKQVRKVIVVPGKLVNIVVGP